MQQIPNTISAKRNVSKRFYFFKKINNRTKKVERKFDLESFIFLVTKKIS